MRTTCLKALNKAQGGWRASRFVPGLLRGRSLRAITGVQEALTILQNQSFRVPLSCFCSSTSQ